MFIIKICCAAVVSFQSTCTFCSLKTEAIGVMSEPAVKVVFENPT